MMLGGKIPMLDEILEFNIEFVQGKKYEQYNASKYPARRIAIVTCMDTRLTYLLPAALGLKNGDAKIIKNAGGIISHPFGSAMRSLLIAIYDLGIKEIFVIAHTDCGARCTEASKMIEKMKNRGISSEDIDFVKYCGVDYESWLGGFIDLEVSVKNSVEMILKHPLVPEDIEVYGLVIDSETGELERVV